MVANVELWNARSTTWRLFLTCWVIYALHFATNTVREIYPAVTLGDKLSFNVAEYVDFHPDLFTMPDGRGFINNNPGASIVAAAPYTLARPLIDRIVTRINARRQAHGGAIPEYQSQWPMAREFYRKAFERGLDVKFALAAGVMQAFCMAPLSALAVVIMYRLLVCRTGSSRVALGLALLYAFATPVFYRTAQINQNLIVAHCALAAFALLWRPWDDDRRPQRATYPLAGLLCGWAVVCDYSGVVVLAVMACYARWRWRTTRQAGVGGRWDFLQFTLGAIASLSVLLLYQWSSFGHPFSPAQIHMPLPAHGYSGMGWPDPELFLRTLFDYRYGLFPSAPLLFLAWFAWMGRGILPRRETWLAVSLILCVVLFCSANRYGYMQFNTGVRHVMPAVPFVFLLTAGVLMCLPKALAVGCGVFGLLWSWFLSMYREVELGWGVLESPIHILKEGPQLPWLTTLTRLGYAHGRLPVMGVWAFCMAIVAVIWWAPWPRRVGIDRAKPSTG